MGNIEDSSKVNLPLKKATSHHDLKPPPPKKHCKTDIVNAIPSSRLTCKISFHKFTPKAPPTETDDDLPEEEWTLPGTGGEAGVVGVVGVEAEGSLLEDLLRA